MQEKKISEQDLEELFNPREPEKPAEDSSEEKLRVHKKVRDESIKKIRKIIRSSHKKKKRKVSYIDVFLIFTSVSGICGFIFFVFLNSAAYMDNIRFWYFDSVLKQGLPESETMITYNSPSPTPAPSKTPTSTPAPSITPPLTPVPTSTPTPAPIKYDEPKIMIPKIGIEAPIMLDVNEDSVLSALERGVAHIGGTAKPGEMGNTFIVGHSSNYPWAKGDYNHIFSLLDELVNGDIITVYFQNQYRDYKVIEKVIVRPDQVEIANSTDKEILSLMTCFPVGTTLKRLVVKTELTH